MIYILSTKISRTLIKEIYHKIKQSLFKFYKQGFIIHLFLNCSMEKIKQFIDNGDLQLATINGTNPQQIQYDHLKQKVDIRNQISKTAKSIDELSPEDKKKWVDTKRTQGNQQFNKGNFKQAIEIYLESIVGIDYSQGNAKEQYLHPILLNMATCFYHSSEYNRGVAICDNILKQYPQHPMANFKKGCLLIKMQEYQQAKECLSRSEKTADEKLKGAIVLQLNLIKKYKGEQSNMYKKMFAAQKEQPQQIQQQNLIINGDRNSELKQDQGCVFKQQKCSFIGRLLSLFCPKRNSCCVDKKQ